MINFIKNKYFYVLVIAVFIAHPAMTEHAEFALSFAKLIEYSEYNTFFNLRNHELSLQIIIPSTLLKIGLSSGVTQIIMTLICTSIILLAQVNLIKYFLKKNYLNRENYFGIIILLISLFILLRPKNITLYPWSPVIYFFEFGNSGLWMTLLASSYYITNQIKKYLFVSLLLVLWHPVWGAANLLFYIIKKRKNLLNIYTAIFLIFALIFLFIINLLIQVNFESILQFKIITDTVYTAHNPILSKDFFNVVIYLFNNYSPILIFILINKYNKTNNLTRINELISYYLIFTSILLVYLEFSRYFSLPLSQIIYRGIPNRYLNLIHVVIVISSICYIFSNLNLNNLKNRWINYISSYFILFILLGHKSTLLILVINFLTFYIYPKEKYLLALAFILFISFFYKNFNSTPYNVLTEYIYNDPVVNFLKNNNHKGGYILSSRVQSYKGLNVGTISNAEYYVPMLTLVNDIDIYCSRTKAYNFNNMNDIGDNCFRNRTTKEWKVIGNSLNLKYVITNENISLNLDLKLKSNGFNIYEIN